MNFGASHEKFRLENQRFLSKPLALTVEQEDIHLLSAYSTSLPDLFYYFYEVFFTKKNNDIDGDLNEIPLFLYGNDKLNLKIIYRTTFITNKVKLKEDVEIEITAG